MALKDRIETLKEEYTQYEYIEREPVVKDTTDVAKHCTGLMHKIYERKLLLEEILEAYKDGAKPGKRKVEDLTERLNNNDKYFSDLVDSFRTEEGKKIEEKINQFFNGSPNEKSETKEVRESPEVQSYQLIYTGLKNIIEMKKAFDLADAINKKASKYSERYFQLKTEQEKAYEELRKYPEDDWKEQMDTRKQMFQEIKELKEQRNSYDDAKTDEMYKHKDERMAQFKQRKEKRDKERGATLEEVKTQHENEHKQWKDKVAEFEKYYDNDYSKGIQEHEKKVQQLETYKANVKNLKPLEESSGNARKDFYNVHDGIGSKDFKKLMIYRNMFEYNNALSFRVEKLFDEVTFTQEDLEEPLENLNDELWEKYELQDFWFDYYIPSEEERESLTIGQFRDFIKEMNQEFADKYDIKKAIVLNKMYERVEKNQEISDEDMETLEKYCGVSKDYTKSASIIGILQTIDIAKDEAEGNVMEVVKELEEKVSGTDKEKYEEAKRKANDASAKYTKAKKDLKSAARDLGIEKEDDVEKKTKELEDEKKEIDSKFSEKLKEWNLDSKEVEELAATGFKNAKQAVNQKAAPQIAEIEAKTEIVQKEIDKENNEIEEINKLFEKEDAERKAKLNEYEENIKQKESDIKGLFKNESVRQQVEKIDSIEESLANQRFFAYGGSEVDMSPALKEMRAQAAFWLQKERLHAGNHKDSTEFKNMIAATKKFLATKPKSANMESVVKELLDTSDKYLIAKNGQRRWFPTKLRKNRMTLAKTLKFNAGLVMQTIEKEKNKYDLDKEYEKNKDAIKNEALNKKNKEEADKKQAELEAKKKQAELEAKKKAEPEVKKEAEPGAKKKDKNSMTLEEKKADGDKYSAIMKKLDEYIAYIEGKADDGMVSDLSSDKRNALGLDVLVEELVAISQEEIEKLSVGEVYSLCRENKTKLNAEIAKEENKLKKPDTNKNVKKNTKLVSDKNLSLEEVKKILSDPKALAKNTTLFDFLENKEAFESEIYDNELEDLTYQKMPKKCKELLSMDIMVNTFKIGTEDKINKMNCIDLMAAIDKFYKSETFEEAKRLHEKMNQPEMEDEGFER